MKTSSARRRSGLTTGFAVTYGENAVLRLPDIAVERGWQRVALICGRSSFEASGASRVLPLLRRRAEVELWRDFSTNPDSRDLQRGLDLFSGREPSAIVGIGGGSAMDMAKLLCAFQGKSSQDVVGRIESGRPIRRRGSDLVLVPTTSGSGSEATEFAVVYVGEKKLSIEGPALKADEVILDPRLARSGSSYQRATSGIDAVAQAVESLWAVGATTRSRRHARWALALLLPTIERFVKEPSMLDARAMCIGSHLAGRAINISKTTAAHALSYGLTKRFGVSHGHAVALTLGHLIEAHVRAEPDRLSKGVEPRRHREAISELLHRLGSADGAQARARFLDLMERVGLATRLKSACSTGSPEPATLIEAVNLQRLGNNPVVLGRTDLQRIVREVFSSPNDSCN